MHERRQSKAPCRAQHFGHDSTNDDVAHATDYTTDDESDNYRTRVRRVRRQHRRRRSAPETTIDHHHHHHHHSHEHVLPDYLDRRYDLDIAPSMVNMDLRFNGAQMVASVLYNILVCKFGYHHMLSIQMLFWMAVHKYYQIHHIDSKANYKLSLCTFLDVVKELSLCSERELSIYTNVAKAHHADSRAAPPPSGPSTTDTTTFPVTSIATPTVFKTPFYRMQHYYVPKDNHTIKLALVHDNLILANLTLFSNFLSARNGVIEFPNSTDQSAGMIVVTIVGYQEDLWIVKFPFGLHWGDNGFGYVPFDYFDRYNRDRWMIDVEECGEPPEYLEQRKKDQLSDNSGLLAAHMNDQIQQTLHSAGQPRQPTKQHLSTHHQSMRRRVF